MRLGLRDAGETLIELLLSILILSLGVVMIVTAVATGAELTIAHRVLTDTDVALKRAAEVVKATPYAEKATSYPLTGITWPTGVTGVTTTVQCLPSSSGSTSTSAATTCAGTDTGLQLVSIQATGNQTSEKTVVMKRKTP